MVLAGWVRLIAGCGGIDCVETDTCSDPDGGGDAAAGPDGAPDATLDGEEAALTDSPGDAGTETAAVADSAGGDATSNGEGGPSDGAAEGSDGSGGVDVTSPDACVVTSTVEDCTNGIDDDCNGATDCADPYCQGLGFACVPQWPGAGAWTAPVALYDLTVPGGPAPTPPSCAGYYPSDILDGHSIPVASPSTCACSCGPVQDGRCTAPSVSVWTSTGCSGTSYSAALLADGGCTVVEAVQDGINAGQIVDAGAPSGSCAPALDASTPVWNAATSSAWADTGRVCAAGARTYLAGAAGGCDAGLVCVDPAPATFGGGKMPALVGSGGLPVRLHRRAHVLRRRSGHARVQRRLHLRRSGGHPVSGGGEPVLQRQLHWNGAGSGHHLHQRQRREPGQQQPRERDRQRLGERRPVLGVGRQHGRDGERHGVDGRHHPLLPALISGRPWASAKTRAVVRRNPSCFIQRTEKTKGPSPSRR